MQENAAGLTQAWSTKHNACSHLLRASLRPISTSSESSTELSGRPSSSGAVSSSLACLGALLEALCEAAWAAACRADWDAGCSGVCDCQPKRSFLLLDACSKGKISCSTSAAQQAFQLHEQQESSSALLAESCCRLKTAAAATAVTKLPDCMDLPGFCSSLA